MGRVAAQIALVMTGVVVEDIYVTDVLALTVKCVITLFVPIVSESASIAKIVFVNVALCIINPVTVATRIVWTSDVKILRWSWVLPHDR